MILVLHWKLFSVLNFCSDFLDQDMQRPEETKRPSPGPDMSRPSSRSSRRGPGQLQI